MGACESTHQWPLLKTPDNTKYVFYQENTNLIQADLSAAAGPMQALAVDATREYREIDLGSLRPGKHTIKLPVVSDWAVVLGRRAGPSSAP